MESDDDEYDEVPSDQDSGDGGSNQLTSPDTPSQVMASTESDDDDADDDDDDDDDGTAPCRSPRYTLS